MLTEPLGMLRTPRNAHGTPRNARNPSEHIGIIRNCLEHTGICRNPSELIGMQRNILEPLGILRTHRNIKNVGNTSEFCWNHRISIRTPHGAPP